MRKIVYLILLSVLLFSCSNVSEVSQIVDKEATLKEIIVTKESDISWTKALEEDRLIQTIYSDKNVSGQISLTPEVVAITSGNEKPIYPELKGFTSLDTSTISSYLLSFINDFCKSVSDNIYNGPQSYFDSNFIFNYVFFKNDLIHSWKNRFDEDFPVQDPSLVNENESKKGKETIEKKQKPLFEKWILGRPFIGDEIMEQPVRFYCQQGFVDVTLYINLGNNKIYQILEGPYDGKK